MTKQRVLIFLFCVISVCVFLGEHVSERLWENFLQHQDTSRCACEKCLSDEDQWFTQRLNKSVEPFLSSKYKLSEDSFRWWTGLQAEKRNFDSYSTTVNTLFKMFPPSPSLIEPSPGRCRTCAVVGNSVNLLGSHYGPLIDFNDVIIRINYGPTKGYEADVGKRTTHRVIYPESASDLDNTTHLVLVPFKIQDLEWLIKALTTGFSGTSYVPVKSNIKANKDLVMVVNPAFMRYVHDTWLEKKGTYPSTGFMTLVLALHICDEAVKHDHRLQCLKSESLLPTLCSRSLRCETTFSLEQWRDNDDGEQECAPSSSASATPPAPLYGRWHHCISSMTKIYPGNPCAASS
ncbi:CMP-N-acetylneuraminate-beta-galactosamide-alpha-2,3-sialyltransferase 1-like [Lates calcarifer]|uniref:CMP-N-acetylneuraminate-beta-galactosamide- alpha-2,3-sialyltransferase 1-like n=1 Tax=Lates calcarifer TaxID=8187 RepID=A0AAJ7LN84_LATCA|nr:CMP-N-acetylneuraminate-beta-galactosamide-alpha-2,3-sialyltransferase 1-like [Lates calcarifer]